MTDFNDQNWSRTDDSAHDDPRFQSILVSCLELLERGEQLDAAQLQVDFPEFADALGEFLEDRQRLVEMASAFRDGGSVEAESLPTLIDSGTTNHEEDRTRRIDSKLNRPSSVALDFLNPTSKPGRIGLLGPYEVIEVIGRGGMGLVLKAHDPHLCRVVAIKTLAPEFAGNATARKRFAREAQAAAAVSHPHVVTIHAVEPAGDLPYLVMEYVQGQSLALKLDKVGSLEVREVLRIGAQIAQGLAAAHEQGLIHRDVKPGNVLLENGVERVKLTDFGLARATDDVAITRTGDISGTPQFMSPEQAEGRPVDVRSDLFSLGSVLYAMCTGRAPFRGDTAVAVLRKVCDAQPRTIRDVNPNVPPWLIDIIEHLMAKDPQYRFQTAGEVARVLNEHLADIQNPSSGSKPKFQRRLPKPPTRRRFRTAVIALAILAAVVLGVLQWRGAIDLLPRVNDGHQRRMASLVGAPTVDETLTEDRVKELVAAAAGISNADWIIFASASEPPTPDMLENRSLSLILFGMPRSTAVQRGDSPPKASNEFEYLTEGTPKPAQLAQAMWVSKSKGYASLIQPEYVTNVTVNVAGDAAYGKVAFEKRGLYRGLIGYVARRSNGDWRIEEFHLPDLGMALECGDDGIWGPMVRSVPGDTPEVEDDDQPEWTSLFNGHDLTGWKTHDERPSNWMVEDGVLVGRGGRLFSERGDYQDFHFRAEVRLRDGANAGVNFRSEYGYGFDLSEVGGNGMVPIGYEVELVPMSETGNRYPSGSILRAPPGAGKWVAATKDEVQADTWFTLEIVVRGSRMTTKIDGAIVAETEEQDPLRPNGHFVLSAMQPLVEFRRIEVRSLSPDPTSVSNLRPRPRDRALIALRLVADRDGARASASVHIGQRFETIEQPSDLRELLRGEVHDATIKGAIQVDSKLRYEFFKSFIVPLSSWVNARTTSNNSIPGELRPIKASTLLDDESPGASIVLELSGSHERFVLPLSPFSESSRADLDSRPPARVRLITRPSKQVGVHLGKLDLGVGDVAIRRLDQELSRKTQLFASPVERLEIELDTDDSVTVADFAQVLRVCQLRRKAADEWERRATLVMIDSSEMPVDEFTSVLSLPVVD